VRAALELGSESAAGSSISCYYSSLQLHNHYSNIITAELWDFPDQPNMYLYSHNWYKVSTLVTSLQTAQTCAKLEYTDQPQLDMRGQLMSKTTKKTH